MSINDDNNTNSAFDKNTLIAIVLMVVVLAGGTFVQNTFFRRDPLPAEPVTQTAPAAVSQAPAALATAPVLAEVALPEGLAAPAAEATTTLSTDLFEATFTNRGGELTSLKLKEHADDQGPVDMLLAEDGRTEGFSLALGGYGSPTVDALFNEARPAPGVVEFSRSFPTTDASGQPSYYTLVKRYEFKDGDYMFKLSVTVQNAKAEAPRLGDGTFAYTLTVGPQIGPRYSQLPKNADWRKIITYEGGKRKVQKAGHQVSTATTSWAAIAGKYFTLMIMPDSTAYTAGYDNVVVNGYPTVSSISLSRPAITASAQTDSFYIYAGPKSNRELARYDDPTANAWKHPSDRLEDVMEGGNMLGWLETGLKWLLNLFYGFVGNYGVAIILVTLLVKAVLFPLTFKGSTATARMQDLQPKMQALQEKYKNNPQKLNEEMAKFYKTEGYNPLSGCLPTLIQFPIFIAMYSLFNNHFDLRGASFIAGWISDLSLPEAVYTFPTINLVIWQLSAIRILPVIYLLSQLAYGKLMQQPTAGSANAGQMKFMMYGMPVMFFFILYNVPSGLLVYWIVSNVVTAIQQVITNRIIHKKRAALAAAAPQEKVIAGKGPKGIKKGRK